MEPARTRPDPSGLVAALVEAGLIGRDDADRAERVVADALGARAEEPAGAPLRRRLAEIAGYVGAAFVVGAAILFFANEWPDLSLGAQVGILLALAAVLLVGGGATVATAGGRVAVRDPAQDVRRRLASVLLTGAAVATALGVGVLLNERWDNEQLGVMTATASGLVVALVGYLLAASTVGQLAIATAAFVMVPSGLASLTDADVSPVAFGTIVLAIGVVWLLLAETDRWRELLSARLIGLGLTLVGSQIPNAGDHPWVGYTLTGLVAVAAFAGYLQRRAWPFLAAGVLGLTIAVPEAVYDLAGDSLGAAGVLLAAGLTLLVAALLGLRLRQEVKEAGAG